MNQNNRFKYLLDQYISGKLTVEEHEEFFNLVDDSNNDQLLAESIQADLHHLEEKKNQGPPPHVSQEIVRNIFNSEKNITAILPMRKKIFPAWQWAAAAAVAGIIISVYLFLPASKVGLDQRAFTAIVQTQTVSFANESSVEKLFLLPDGSKVTLQPGSHISYPKQFAGNAREIYLEGEAFFKVVRNPRQPFYVYYNKIVTKVLGTSFRINTNPVTGNAEVAVSTGKVQVYENDKGVKADGLLNSVIVTQNQKAIYKKDNKIFETTLVERPLPLHPHDDKDMIDDKGLFKDDIAEAAFVFDQEKLSAVFKKIETTYGIEMVVDNANIYNCVFTGDVTNQDLYTKLKIICLTTNAAYEVNGTRILIKGKGCN